MTIQCVYAINFRKPFTFKPTQQLSQQHLSLAPGEGKLPENILSSEKWDALAFAMKYPDGKNNLHQKTEVILLYQHYFVQRLRNKDSRFRKDLICISSLYWEETMAKKHQSVHQKREKSKLCWNRGKHLCFRGWVLSV